MCDPVSLAAGTTAVSLFQQGEAADAQNEFNRAAYETNRERAAREGSLATGALVTRTMQERTAASVETQRVQSDADYAIGQANNALLESGASGATARAVVRDFARRGSEFRGGQNINRQIADAQFTQESRAINSQTAGRIDSARRAGVARPSFLNALVQIGGAAAGAYFQTPDFKAGQLAKVGNAPGASGPLSAAANPTGLQNPFTGFGLSPQTI